jgi:hypothetical protein
MPSYTGNYIHEMNKASPVGSESKSLGDDAIREIKRVLQTVFPNLENGTPIIATAAELNHVDGCTSNIQTQLNGLTYADTLLLSRIETIEDYNVQTSLYAPTGTRTTFYQPTAPTGWTKVSGLDDRMMVINNSFGGLSGGAQTPVSLNLHHAHLTGDVSLTGAQMPGHAHQISVEVDGGPGGYDGGGSGASHITVATAQTSIAGNNGVGGDGQPHNHGSTSGLNWTFTALNTNNDVWAPKYINMILCSKDAP